MIDEGSGGTNVMQWALPTLLIFIFTLLVWGMIDYLARYVSP
ncbi:MAG TPA: hypothetical protein VLJ39_17090 [Tepidisphaeraceae bacterium]|nr:hypothetical protein [Tepidisphaeraceae bacterium]